MHRRRRPPSVWPVIGGLLLASAAVAGAFAAVNAVAYTMSALGALGLFFATAGANTVAVLALVETLVYLDRRREARRG